MEEYVSLDCTSAEMVPRGGLVEQERRWWNYLAVAALGIAVNAVFVVAGVWPQRQSFTGDARNILRWLGCGLELGESSSYHVGM